MKQKYRQALHTVLPLLTAILLSTTARVDAQSTTSDVAGIVRDQKGQPVPEVQIVARNKATGSYRITYTDDRGGYRIGYLTPGTYQVIAEHLNYARAIHDNVRLLIGQTDEVDFSLISKDIQASEVVIEANAPLINVKKSDISVTVQPEQIESLPLNSRNFLELATIAPGAKSSTGGRGPVTTGALNSRFITAYIDGVDFKNNDLGGVLGTSFGVTTNIVPEDAIQEFQVITSMYKAEYSGASNGIINAITKSGGNEFHGSAFGLFRTEGLNARGPFEKTKPDYNRQQMGISLGGPIIKDKTHFFFSYERDNINNFITVNTSGRQPQLDGTFKSPTIENLGLVKLTHNISSNNSLDFRWLSVSTDNNPGNFGGTTAYSNGFNLDFRLNSYLLNDRWAISDNLVNELRLHYLRYRKLASPISTDPQHVYLSSGIATGWNGNQPQTENQDSYELRDDISYFVQGSTGTHVLKSGFTLARERLSSDAAFLSGGSLIFKSDTSSLPIIGVIGLGNPLTQTWNTDFGVYVQDDWSPLHNLNFNLGVRWDVANNMINNNYVNPLASDTALTNHVSPDFIGNGNRKIDLNNVAPRAGFSWDIFDDQTTVLHGGVGVFYDRIIWNFPANEQQDGVYNIYTMVFNKNLPPTLSRDSLIAYVQSNRAKQAAPGVTLLPSSMPTPYTVQMSLGVTRQISSDLVASLDYVRISGYNEYTTYNINYTKGIGGPRVLTPAFGAINLVTSQGRSWYDGIDFSLTRPYMGDWQMQISYTLSWAFDTFDDPFAGYVFQSSILRAPSAQDERHRFVASGTVNLPYDFQLSGIMTFSSPRPIYVITGTDNNNDGVLGDDFPPSGRNSVRPDPGKIRNWNKDIDLRISRYFSIAGTTRLMLLVEAFNIFNWTNYTAYIGRLNAVSGGVSIFGDAISASNTRQVQVGLRLLF
ncbi:MAG: TonB-dependent receptor [Bacteroidetes bacterium]|nr:TonB-dependent receptor [Bacteroidota bacterium]MCL5737764.1 TonB-dependent receptor [Bacteroidota bacterium]